MRTEQLLTSQIKMYEFRRYMGETNSLLSPLDEQFRNIAITAARFAIFASKDAITAMIQQLEARYKNEDLPDKESWHPDILADGALVKRKFLAAGRSGRVSLRREEYFLRLGTAGLLARLNAARALNYVQGATLSQEDKEKYFCTWMAAQDAINGMTSPVTSRRGRKQR